MHDPIVPVILCGGSGSRLWPLSRKSFPKQFSAFIGTGSLFQAALERVSGPLFKRPVAVTASDFRFIVTEQMAAVGVDPGAILIEPEPRNTAPAIVSAAVHVAQSDPDALILALPSDHVMPDIGPFEEALRRGIEEADAGRIVTLGIAPDRPATGYGWLECETHPGDGPLPLVRFVEKPDHATAEAMLASGRYLWNAGMFLFRASTLIETAQRHAPEILDLARRSVAEARTDLGFLRLAPEPWSAMPDISVDYALMERADALSVVPYAGRWNDLGTWAAVQAELSDRDGNALSGDATALDCSDSLLRAESPGQRIVGLGLEGVVAVAMRDAVLIAARDRAEDVRMVVEALRAEGAPQADVYPRDHRPWGWFETLTRNGRYQVKRIVVHPGRALSLQSHVHRAEHWIVVAGTARVTVNGDRKLVAENESVFIPLGARHRLENPGKVDLELIEVQTGAYLGEDDITRYDDPYARE
ncbi:MAG: mannose-1-phosphate guanylyltransferase/mannose-6-phosphate isomerase [Rubricella sp.]